MTEWRWVSDTVTPGVFMVQRNRREVAMVSFADRIRYPAIVMQKITEAMAAVDVDTMAAPDPPEQEVTA